MRLPEGNLEQDSPIVVVRPDSLEVEGIEMEIVDAVRKQIPGCTVDVTIGKRIKAKVVHGAVRPAILVSIVGTPPDVAIHEVQKRLHGVLLSVGLRPPHYSKRRNRRG